MNIIDKLNNKAKELRVLPDRVIRHYAMERFLYRLAISPYSDKLFLKGGMLMLGIGAPPGRNTLDIDLLGRIDRSQVVRAIRDITKIRIGGNDGISFSQDITTQDITKDALYAGIRVQFHANVAGKKYDMKVDIGFSDEVYPTPRKISYPVMLSEMPQPLLACYTKESIIAEKWQAMIQLGVHNSRMKDFYDLWFLSRNFTYDFCTLQTAIMRTCERRGTNPQLYKHLLDDIYLKAQQPEWAAYVRKLKSHTYQQKTEHPLPSRYMADIIAEIMDWLTPVMENNIQATWHPGKGWIPAPVVSRD